MYSTISKVFFFTPERNIPKIASMPKRYTIREKKDYLRRYTAFDGIFSDFCEQEGLLKGTFSKWVKNQGNLLLTPDDRKTVKRKDSNPQKTALAQWVVQQTKQGVQVDVITLLHHVKRTAPSILATSTSYNSEYVLCRRLLLDIQPRQIRQELEEISTSLLNLSVSTGPAVDTSMLYEHGEHHRYTNDCEAIIRVNVQWGYCDCQGE